MKVLPISSGTTQHLIDTNDVERVYANTEMEGIFSRCLGNILVGANTGGFECFARELLILIGYKMAAEREILDGCPLTAQIVDTDLKSQ